MSSVNVTIGRKIRAERRGCGMSTGELSGLTGISQQQITRYERGACKISADMLYQLGQVFRCDHGDFFTGISSGDIRSADPAGHDTTAEWPATRRKK